MTDDEAIRSRCGRWDALDGVSRLRKGVDWAEQFRADVEDLLAENRQLRREAVGAGRTVTDLEGRIERLEDGIRQHRGAMRTRDVANRYAVHSGTAAQSVNERLWALLDEETT